MSRPFVNRLGISILVVAICLPFAINVPAAELNAPAGPPAAVDAFGDPLPDEAVLRLGTVRLRHGGDTCAVAFSPDSATLATGGRDAAIRIWDIKSGRMLRQFIDPRGSCTNAVAYSPDGATLAAGGAQGTVRLWDLESGKPKFEVHEHSCVTALAFARDGQSFASTGKDGFVRVWDAKTGKVLHKLRTDPDGDCHPVAFSPDGTLLADAANDTSDNVTSHAIRIWNLRTGGDPIVITREHWATTSLTFLSDGKGLVSGDFRTSWSVDDDGNRDEKSRSTMRTWDAATGQLIREVPRTGTHHWAFLFALSPDEKTYVSTSDTGIVVADFATGQTSFTMLWNGHPSAGHPHGLVISPDGKLVAARSTDCDVLIWDLATGELLNQQVDSHSAPISVTRFSPDGKTVATAGDDHTVRLWDADSGKLVRTLELPEGRKAHAMAFSPDGRTLVVGGELMEIPTGYASAWWAYFKYVVNSTAGDTHSTSAVVVFDTETGKRKASFPAKAYVTALAFSRDGSRLAAASALKTHLYGGTSYEATPEIRVWDTQKYRIQCVMRGHEWQTLALAFSDDNSTLFSVSEDQTLRQWDAATGKETKRHEISGFYRGWGDGVQYLAHITNAVFSPDQKMVYTYGYLGDLVAGWNVSTGKPNLVLRMSNLEESALALSPDGSFLATAYHDAENPNHSIWIWDTKTGDILRKFKTGEIQSNSLDFSPDGERLISGMSDGTALIWKRPTPK